METFGGICETEQHGLPGQGEAGRERTGHGHAKSGRQNSVQTFEQLERWKIIQEGKWSWKTPNELRLDQDTLFEHEKVQGLNRT